MTDSKNFAIGVLSTTAAILLVGLVITHSRPAPALASGMAASGGDYILTVGGTTQVDEQYLYVVDSTTEKMIVYRFDSSRGQIDIVQGMDLSELRKSSATQPGQQPPKQPGRTRQP
jgi:hypothetical protein